MIENPRKKCNLVDLHGKLQMNISPKVSKNIYGKTHLFRGESAFLLITDADTRMRLSNTPMHVTDQNCVQVALS